MYTYIYDVYKFNAYNIKCKCKCKLIEYSYK